MRLNAEIQCVTERLRETSRRRSAYAGYRCDREPLRSEANSARTENQPRRQTRPRRDSSSLRIFVRHFRSVQPQIQADSRTGARAEHSHSTL